MTDYEIVKAFVDRVCRQAERNMALTGKLEGAHYAAMIAELGRMEPTSTGKTLARYDDIYFKAIAKMDEYDLSYLDGKRLTGCRCDLSDSPDAPTDWHGEDCPMYKRSGN